jgi:hypothetical protein
VDPDAAQVRSVLSFNESQYSVAWPAVVKSRDDANEKNITKKITNAMPISMA